MDWSIAITVLVLVVVLDLANSQQQQCSGSISTVEYGALQSMFVDMGGTQWQWNQLKPSDTQWQLCGSMRCSLAGLDLHAIHWNRF